MATKRKRTKLLRIEKLLYTGAFLALILTVVVEVFLTANVSNLKMEIEKQNYQIREQSKKNESLSMKVSELTSFDNIKDVVKDMGLAYNRDSIINIED